MTMHIPRPEALQQKVDQLKKGGVKALHIVSDFDRTLTRGYNIYGKVQSTYALIRDGRYLSDSYTKKAYAMFDKYHPYEIDPELSMEEKYQKMNEWWAEHWDLMEEEGMSLAIIQKMIANKQIMLREGCKEFLNTLERLGIPMLIISAGLGDIIKEFMRQTEHTNGKIHIISNFFTFDEEGIVNGSEPGYIHTFNKAEVEVKGTSYEAEIMERKNVILLGDQVGDADMCVGVDHELVLKVGFLNKDVEKHIEKYSNHFDVIILSDGSMNYVLDLLKEIAQES